MEPAEILKKPYVRQVVPQADGLFKAEILEFPGCFAIGDTSAEALTNLDEVARDWLAATIAHGQDVPEPTESTAFSGKFVLRMAKTLHRKATQYALRDGASLNQFIVNCVAEHVGTLAKPMVYSQPLHANFTVRVSGGWLLQAMSGPLLLGAATPTGPDRLPVSRWQYQDETRA